MSDIGPLKINKATSAAAKPAVPRSLPPRARAQLTKAVDPALALGRAVSYSATLKPVAATPMAAAFGQAPMATQTRKHAAAVAKAEHEQRVAFYAELAAKMRAAMAPMVAALQAMLPTK